MDQDERIEQLKEEARRLSDGQMQAFGIDDLPKDMAEEFLKRVVAFETGPTTTNFEQLSADRVPLPPPDEVADREIGVVLWRVIFGLAKLRVLAVRYPARVTTMVTEPAGCDDEGVFHRGPPSMPS